ncbi:hypothetical protein K458DRAFT_329424 [Lentithecium fluviatile CBS 122367]|uniref:Phosphatidate phosphatase APP1 catalytic domain-containing protein n=1 Tax=Lentithecium fluviatile CBS 122367 TaxID=1168545 RepID=A0A6G1JGD6_9PLEO|nr:hypothetical protein K458DRAFT_329424 [Lentithecium fluviatile CBS 122367]
MSVLVQMFTTRWFNPPKPVNESYEGRNIIVTGATSGIGLEAVGKFAALGASKVIIAARNLEKGESTKASIAKRLGGRSDRLEVWELEMSSYESVVAFAKRAEMLDHLDVAILNAGVHRIKYGQSKHGWEEDLQVNTLSTTLLGILLLPKLKASRATSQHTPILEFVNSGLHQNAIVSDDVRRESNILKWYNKPENFSEGSQYKFTKAFLMYAVIKLAEEVSSKDVIIISVCPGLVATSLGRDHHFPGVSLVWFILGLLVAVSPEVGANALLGGTTQGEKAHGRFWKSNKIMPIPPSVAGEENKKLALQIWNEIVGALKQDVAVVMDALKASLWMPKPRLRRPHGTSSLLRYLFPHTSLRARAQLSRFRHETLPSLKHRTQSRIYKYILFHQARKLKGKVGILQRLRGHTNKLLGTSRLENEARLRRQKLIKSSESGESRKRAMSYQDYAPREAGARRKKFAGYLKAANELRQTYQQQYAPGWSRSEATYDYEDDTPGSFPDAAIVRSGDEEMILFPSYARKHIKRKPEAEPGTIQETPGGGRDVRDTAGAGDAEFWKQQWDNYEDDNAIVDVDVRGWIYSPHKGQMSRKQRLFIGLARQLVGIQAPPAGTKPASASESPRSSREPSPGHITHRELAQARQAQRDEYSAAKEAEEILRKGEREAEMAAKGAYSEKPALDDTDNTQDYRTENPEHTRVRELSNRPSLKSLKSDESITPLQKRASWNQPADMSAAELAEANARLMARLRHFLAIPMANTPISVFFYNNEISKQRTIYTNPSGHFSISAALDFIPTHVRILASDKLSATEEVMITESSGISVISDIDDTIKHSAISSGAREIFRNAFIRDLGDLTIDGVREWYNKMAELGVKFHYVSNSPWQLYPVIAKYFSLAGLPPGSFHLKQYSGMLQGIFEPVAERKKSTLDKIARDFPERRFILIGDSGEADLEVYTDFVLENPGRVVAVFIRDVTTTEGGGFFDPSVESMPGDRSSSSSQRESGGSSNKVQASSEEDDPEFRAAIAASLRDLEEEEKRRSKSLFPPIDDDHPELRPSLPARRTQPPSAQPPVQDLIDLSPKDEKESPYVLRRVNTDSQAGMKDYRASVASFSSVKTAPPPPRKPAALRSSSGDSSSQQAPSKAPLPPKPRQTSSMAQNADRLSQQASVRTPASTGTVSRPPVAPKPNLQSQQSYAGMARDKLSLVYNSLPSATEYLSSRSQQDTPSNTEPSENALSMRRAPPPPPPPRRSMVAYPVAAASYVGTKANSAWQHAPPIPHRSTRPNQSQPYTTSSPREGLNRTNTSSTVGSTLGMNGGNGDGGGVYNKREMLWRQRWARAEQILAEKGVVLKSWRVGTDIVGEAERLIQRAEKERKSGNGNGNVSGRGR